MGDSSNMNEEMNDYQLFLLILQCHHMSTWMNNILKFKALVGIAKADGDFDSSEKSFIRRLADLEGISSAELKEMLQKEGKAKDFAKDLDFDEKIEILIYVVKLMKIDGKVLLSEIKYCEKIAKILGFEEKSVGFLSGIIESDPDITTNMGRIKHRMRKYLA